MNAGSLSAAVGHRIRQLRLRAGFSLGRLAKKVGLSGSALQRIEEGGAPASVGTLNDLARHLGTTVAELVRQARVGETAPTETRGSSGPSRLEQVGRAILDLPDGIDKLRAAEDAALRLALEVCNGNKSAAARLLGAQRQAFQRRLKRAPRRLAEKRP
jgi:transcriptional regulator with XRE-family HTH domain